MSCSSPRFAQSIARSPKISRRTGDLARTCVWKARTGRKRADVDPADMRGDAILYLRKNTDLSDAEGYHDRHYLGIPYGFVFLDLSAALGEDWSVTFSHEALELTADP